MGVSVSKKRARPHLPPLPETETAVGPMARPAGHPREHDGGTTASSPRRGGVAASGYPGRATTPDPLYEGPKRNPQTGVPPVMVGILPPVGTSTGLDCQRGGIPPIQGWEEVKSQHHTV